MLPTCARPRPSPAPGTRPQRGAPRPRPCCQATRSPSGRPRGVAADTTRNSLSPLPGKSRARHAGRKRQRAPRLLQRAKEERKQLIICLLVLTLLRLLRSAWPSPPFWVSPGAPQPERESQIQHSPSWSPASPYAPRNLEGCLSAGSRGPAPELGRRPVRGGALHLERCSPLTTSREPAPRSAAARGSAADAPARPRPFTKQTFPREVSGGKGAQSAPITT